MLTVDLLQLNEFHVEICKRVGTEEIGSFVKLRENGFFPGGYYGRKLVEVAHKYHLDAPEGLVGRRPVEAQEFVHTVQQVRPHHRYLINYQDIQLLIDAVALLSSLYFQRRDIRLEAEEGVDGLAFNVESRYAGGSKHHNFLACYTAVILEQRGFAGAGTACYENAPVRLLHEVQGTLELFVYFDVLHCCVSRLYNTTQSPLPAALLSYHPACLNGEQYTSRLKHITQFTCHQDRHIQAG